MIREDNDIKNQQKESTRLYPNLRDCDEYFKWIRLGGYVPAIQQLNHMRPSTLDILSKLLTYEQYDLSKEWITEFFKSGSRPFSH